MEHMYVHRVVLGECVGMLVAIFGFRVNWMYTGFGILVYAAVMLPKFFCY